MIGGSVTGATAGGARSGPRATLEILAIVALFAAAGSWPAPDVNEAVYLTKARHWADPAWGRGDFFLESRDAHSVFFMAFGPLASVLPLDTAAWCGRVLGWLAVAAGFRHAIAPLVGGARGRIAAAAIFSISLRFTTAAGEWVIGGCEAKVFSWALVLGGVGEAIRGRFGPGWCLCGAAAALHPIVGGWALVAVAAPWLADRRPGGVRPANEAGGSRMPAAWLAAGLALAACGVVPALGLSAGADAATRAAAHAIHVIERLPHHLLPRSFAAGLVARHLLAIAVWWLLWRLLPATGARRRLAVAVGAALAVSLAGWLVSLAEPVAPGPVHAILRFYWFRSADVLVALAVAAAVAAVLEDDACCRSVIPAPPALVRAVAATLLLLDLAAESSHWPLPGRALPSRADSKVDAAGWEDACAWVRGHVPVDACFLTPRGSASFTWRTGRREVVSWKNSPQDAVSLVEWRRRITDCFSRDGGTAKLETSTATLGSERMSAVAERYGAEYAIVPLDACGAGALPFPRLYANAAYAVLRLDRLTAGERPAAPP